MQEAIEGLEGSAARGAADSSGPEFVEMAGTAINITSDFKANLAQLPEVANVESIELKFKDSGEVCDVIENKPGKSGSVKVYQYLLQQFGGEISRQAAHVGVALYAEHLEDTHANPGKHPNIERLLTVASSGRLLIGAAKMC